MMVVPINEAEAMLAPFFESHPGGGGETDSWRLSADREAVVKPGIAWLGLSWMVQKPVSGRPVVAAESRCNVDLQGYDRLLVFAQIPRWMTLSVHAILDGRSLLVLPPTRGTNTFDEFDGPLRGRRLQRLRLEIEAVDPRPGLVTVSWLGLARRVAESARETRLSTPARKHADVSARVGADLRAAPARARRSRATLGRSRATLGRSRATLGDTSQYLRTCGLSPYRPRWPGFLSAARPGRIEPRLGLFFDAEGLVALRRRCREGALARALSTLRRAAENDLRLCPEQDIGEFVPTQSAFFSRRRDRAKIRTSGRMERLALVGLLDADPRMLCMAARMALSAAHCRHWCEGIQTVLPGGTWRHKAFVESEYTQSCALVLDWAGCCLTPRGEEAIRQAIINKGLPGIEATLRCSDEVWICNQGVVFAAARLLGLLALSRHYPRYRQAVEEAARDWRRTLRAYIQPDGGALEGPGYWSYTLGQALPALWALARFHGRTPTEEAPPEIHRTAAFALGLLSTGGDGDRWLPINDARAHPVPAGVAAGFANLTGDSLWWRLYRSAVSRPDPPPAPWCVVLAPRRRPSSAPLLRAGWRVFPRSGHVDCARIAPGVGIVHFHFYSGPTLFTHFHEDKGSFILEAAGESLAMDRGITPYDHPETARLKWAECHNLLYPEPNDENRMAQPATARGGRIAVAVQEGGCVIVVGDQRQAWAPGVFRRSVRRVISPAATWFLFDDEVVLTEARAVSFRLNTRAELRRENDVVWVLGRRAWLRVRPLNWRPEVVMGPEGVDGELQTVNLLRLRASPAREHRLLTSVEIVPAGRMSGGSNISFSGREVHARGRGEEFIYRLAADGRTCLRWETAGRRRLEGRFAGTRFWRTETRTDARRGRFSAAGRA